MSTFSPTPAPAGSDETARQIARVLLDVGAVAINAQNPFTYSSGAKSPVYCDNRLLISYPDERRRVIDAMVHLVSQEVGLDHFDVVAGVATSGIPWAAWLADALAKPMVYIRDAPKGHGRGQRVEGVLTAGQRAVIIEDLVTTGRSSLWAVEGARETGAVVERCIAIFSYEWAQAAAAFAAAGVQLSTLSRISTLVQVALAAGNISQSDLNAVQAWVAEHS